MRDISETDLDVVEDVEDDDDGDDGDNDENTPINDENAFSHSVYAPVHRSSSVLALRTPLSNSRTDHDTALRDITDQFFHPPSPSPVRVSKRTRSAAHSFEPPRRPKKPKSLAYPADPPNWLYSRSTSTLPPSSPPPPSTTNIDHASTARYEYHLGTPSKASDSDPFGFVAVERALKAKRLPHKYTSVKSPPRSTILPSAPSKPSIVASSSLVPTNNEDIDGLYADEPVAGPSHAHASTAPLLMMNSDQPYVDLDATGSQPTFPDPLRTPRKRKRRASPTPDGDPDSDDGGTSIPSSPSPVKVSVGVGAQRRPGTVRPSDASVFKVTRAQSKTVGSSKPTTLHPSRTKQVKKSYQDIPTPSSTPASVRRGVKQSIAPPSPAPPRRSTRQATMVARAGVNGSTSNGKDGHGSGRMKLRSRDTKGTTEAKTTKVTASAKDVPSKSKAKTRTQQATTSTRGRSRGNARAKDTKGKGKGHSLENVLELSEDTQERYEKERRERLKYFKRLEDYQIQKENVYVV